MGLYLNPGNEEFRNAAIHSKIYVDKTEMIKFTNSQLFGEHKNICVSRPRRFGKSMAANMLVAYYSKGCDSKELFENFKIADDSSFKEHLNKYNVIHLNIQQFLGRTETIHEMLELLSRKVTRELKREFADVTYYEEDLVSVIEEIYAQTHSFFVFIIDEWDCVIRNSDDKALVHQYLQFLHSLFKSEESKTFLALGYITGILPIKKIWDESALNNFCEYTMLKSKPITKFYGFTEEEVKELCKKYQLDFDSVKAWYNGYLIDGIHMYNPNSVVQALLDQDFDSYWKNTSSFASINTFVTMNYAGLKDDVMMMLAGGKVRVNTSTFQNDFSTIASKDDALTALIHLGYLGYDADRKKAFIPNYEVASAFESALQVGGWSEIAKAISHCDELLDETIDGNAERVAELIEIAHDTYTSILKYNDENSLSCVLTMAYFTAPAYYNIIREMPAMKGFADMVFIPRKNAGFRPAMVVELKYDESADSAITQIKERRYHGALSGYSDKILLVGVNYDAAGKDKKRHTCVIEEWPGDILEYREDRKEG